jgi:hypothetical protein
MTRRRTVLAILLALLATAAVARVISYSPYTDRTALPAQQHRMNHYFALVESAPPGGPGPLSPIYYGYPADQLVVYDSTGQEEPRVVLPQDGTYASFTNVAVRENNGVPVILAQTNADLGNNAQHQYLWVLSNDGGKSWKSVQLPVGAIVTNLTTWQVDTGGPWVKARYSPIRIGTASFPFVLSINGFVNLPPTGAPPPPWGSPTANVLYAIGADASVKQLVSSTTTYFSLVGSDKDDTRFLVRGPQDTLSILDLSGNLTKFSTIGFANANSVEGWIASNGDVYLEERTAYEINAPGQVTFGRWSNGTRIFAMFQPASFDSLGIFGIPTFDYSGAWILQRGSGKPTTLTFHDASGAKQQWSDITAPEVEALHAGASGNTLLIQEHRPRPQIDQRLFKDPALAFWHTGDAAPRVYDELFMNEQTTKGFVHLDVDRAATGEPFVFDSGAMAGGVVVSPPVSGAPPTAGGGDIIQEWGVVRASFAQHLVLPGIGRTPGAYGSFWQSDVVIHNPSDVAQKVLIRYVANGGDHSTDVCLTGPSPAICVPRQTTLTLQPQEIRVIPDALKSLFQLDSGNGVFFIDPESGVNATSRTFTRTAAGTYGYGMNAIDMFGGTASPRFPVTFSGAFPGPNFRTNLVLTDVSGRGTTVAASALGFLGTMGTDGVSFSAPMAGQQQINGIASTMGLASNDYGALVIKPTSGEAIASVFTIDNRTNDPTYFPPDLPAPVVRTIPVIGHIAGANNAMYRSDLYLYNPSELPRQLTLQMKMWDSSETLTVTLTLLGKEARVIPDAMTKLFNRTGLARLRYQSSGDSSGVRVTSRTYSIDENGGTYGFLMPPLNNFQSAASGDSLEILGIVGGSGFRTNIGLVDLTSFATATPAATRIEIIDDKGKKLDSFMVNVPSAGGMQIGDVFHERGLGDGPAAALIRITPTSGLIGAYVTVNDNGTNDPTYVAANLAARQ